MNLLGTLLKRLKTMVHEVAHSIPYLECHYLTVLYIRCVRYLQVGFLIEWTVYKSGIRSMQPITGNCMPCLEEQIDVKSSIDGNKE